MTINRNNLLLFTTLLWALFIDLSAHHRNVGGLLNVVGFLSMIIVPGLLTMLSLRIESRLPFWYRLGLIIGFSVVELMGGGLIWNTLLPKLHFYRPLDHVPLLYFCVLLYAVIAIVSWFRLKRFAYGVSLPSYSKLFHTPSFVFLAFAPVFIILAIMGATLLNNGGSGIITLFMLLFMAVYLCFLIYHSGRMADDSIAWAIYFCALSLLLMTSLRGWYTTGHDIQREYHVFQLTEFLGRWSIANFRDPYNACLSITILPVMFQNLLHVRDPYIFKTFFQFIFASVPVLVFMFMRRYISKTKSLLAAIYFFSFPTFFTDMPFLNRQEVGFLFLMLMMLVGFDTRLSMRMRQWLFILFGFAMTISHYSTTYSVLGILLFASIAKPIFLWSAKFLNKKKLLKQSGVDWTGQMSARFLPAISLPVVIVLLYFAFMWINVMTNTAQNAANVVTQVITSVRQGLGADAKSNDVNYSIFSNASANPQKELNIYLTQVVDKARSQAPPGVYYSDKQVAQYPLHAVKGDQSPLTAPGRRIQSLGINVTTLNGLLKSTWAKLLQVFVIIGLVYVLFRKKHTKKIESELYVIAIGSVLFILAQVVLPYVSVAYGLLRAFQQSLMVLGLFLVLGTYAFSSWLRLRLLKSIVPAALAIVFFLASTGVVAQLLGGYQPQLHLNNDGQYYDIYYLHKTEVTAINWLNNLTSNDVSSYNVQREVQTDRYAFSKITSLTNINPANDITPGLIRQNSYVYLGYTDAVKQQATISYEGDLFSYAYPKAFLDQHKNLIYSNGGSDIYR